MSEKNINMKIKNDYTENQLKVVNVVKQIQAIESDVEALNPVNLERIDKLLLTLPEKASKLVFLSLLYYHVACLAGKTEEEVRDIEDTYALVAKLEDESSDATAAEIGKKTTKLAGKFRDEIFMPFAYSRMAYHAAVASV